ncbi:MAG: SHOCT domain-containing protein [Candidatus Cloacimonetes bacterium]|nr:SHOCT domain-containing protein [Candidatus Cloacimonadota bacterium]
MNNLEKVFLIHGFHSDSSSMNDIYKVLKVRFNPVMIDLPSTFSSLPAAANRLIQKVLSHCHNNTKDIHFVAHSAGGIITRIALMDNRIADLAKYCVFVASPNHGTELAELHEKIPVLLQEIHLPVKQLSKHGIEKLNLRKPKEVVYAGIAGNKPWDKTELNFSGTNDGVVAVQSVMLEEMIDFITVPFDHFEIHHCLGVCKAVEYFLKNGYFPKQIKERKKMKINEKFSAIIKNGRINELCNEIGWGNEILPAIDSFLWDILGDEDGWQLQLGKLFGTIRILNPDNYVKAFGLESKVIEAIDFIFERIRIDQYADNALTENKIDSSSDDDKIFEKLRKLKQLKEEGVITEEEYQAKKSELLKQI